MGRPARWPVIETCRRFTIRDILSGMPDNAELTGSPHGQPARLICYYKHQYLKISPLSSPLMSLSFSDFPSFRLNTSAD